MSNVCPNCHSNKNVYVKKTGFFNHTYGCTACSKDFEGEGYIQPVCEVLKVTGKILEIVLPLLGSGHSSVPSPPPPPSDDFLKGFKESMERITNSIE